MTATRRAPLGTFVGARSGDKGGAANIGLWVVDPVEAAAVALAHGAETSLDVDPEAMTLADRRYAWLVEVVTVEGLRTLLPETASLRVDVHLLPNLRAINIVIHGILGRGVAQTTRVDPQAKGLGEHLRARHVDIPLDLFTGGAA